MTAPKLGITRSSELVAHPSISPSPAGFCLEYSIMVFQTVLDDFPIQTSIYRDYT
jgi:hypothetical protein